MDARFALLLALLLAVGLRGAPLPDRLDARAELRLRDLRARRGSGARGLHGRARAGRRGGGALRDAAAPAGPGVRRARAGDRPLRPRRARRHPADQRGLRRPAGRRQRAARRRRHAAATLFQLGAAFAVLLPPTVFMGATLPLLARHAVRSEAEIGSRVGVLYAVNTAGAIAGTLCAAFWLMPELGLRRTVWVGAALNGLVFALAALLARGAATPLDLDGAALRAVVDAPAAPPGSCRSIALSGAVSFAYEVLWTRLLGHLLGASLDAFAMHAGELPAGHRAREAPSRRAWRRAVSAPRSASAWPSSGSPSSGTRPSRSAERLPELALRLGAGPDAPLASAAVAAAALLPITLCIGATFPFAVRLLARSPEQAAAATARAYAWNTVGAIARRPGRRLRAAAPPRLRGDRERLRRRESRARRGHRAALAPSPHAARGGRRRGGCGAARAARRARRGRCLTASPFSGATTARSDRLLRRRAFEHGAPVRSRGFAFVSTPTDCPSRVIERAGILPVPEIARLLGLLPALLRPEARDLLADRTGRRLPCSSSSRRPSSRST